MKKETLLSFIAGAIAGAVVATFVGVSNQADIQPVPQHIEGSVDFLIDSGEIKTYTDVQLGEIPTVFSTLHELTDIGFTEYDELGVFVQAIDNKGGEGNEWWQYWVNGEYAQIAADKYMLKPGDVVLWKLTAQEYEELDNQE